MSKEQLKLIYSSNKHCLKYRIKALIKMIKQKQNDKNTLIKIIEQNDKNTLIKIIEQNDKNN